MEALTERLREQLAALSLPRKETRLEELERELAGLERELDEVEQRIPFWDRVVFFDDTEDEARAKSLRESIDERTEELEELRETVRLDREAIAAEYPPYAIGRSVARCRRASREVIAEEGLFGGLEVPESLVDELETIGRTIADTWIAEYDLEEIRSVLLDENRREIFAGEHVEFDSDDAQLGWAPIDQRSLIAACVASLEERQRDDMLGDAVKALEIAISELETDLDEVSEDVSLVDKVNYFSESLDEARQKALEEELTDAERELDVRSAELLHLVESTLGVFPPLAIQIAAHEALGAAHALHTLPEASLSDRGAPTETVQVKGRAVLLAAIRRLRGAFERAFPGVPTELEHLPTRAGSKLLDDFAAGFERRGAYDIVELALAQAHLESTSRIVRDEIDDRVGWLPRAVFWSDTEDEAALERLDERIEWHRTRYHQAVNRLRRLAYEEGAEHPPIALRDRAIRASIAVADIHTDGGSSSIPKSCSVYGRDVALDAIHSIRNILEEHYGFHGGRRSFVRDVADCVQQGRGEAAREASAFVPLPYEDIVRRVAGRLGGTRFPELVEQVEQFESAATRADSHRAQAEANVSIWDRINIFTTTEDEATRDAYREELDQLSQKLEVGLSELDSLIEEGMAAYPPAHLYYRIDSVLEAVLSIRAVCRSRTVTVGTGKNRRTETRYYCALVGKSEAVETMHWWNRTFVHVFGGVPTYDELLAHWIRSR